MENNDIQIAKKKLILASYLLPTVKVDNKQEINDF